MEKGEGRREKGEAGNSELRFLKTKHTSLYYYTIKSSFPATFAATVQGMGVAYLPDE